MRIYSRLAIIVGLALLSAGGLSSGASASRALRVTRQNITATAAGASFLSAFVNIVCDVTLRGEITREQVEKTAAGRLPEGQIGRITEGSTANCTNSFRNAEVNVSAAAPFLIRYDGFKGTLPRITHIALTVLTSLFRIFPRVLGGGRCAYGGEIPVLAFESRGGQEFDRIETRNLATRERLVVVIWLEVESNQFCEHTGRFGAVFTVSPPIRVTLVN